MTAHTKKIALLPLVISQSSSVARSGGLLALTLTAASLAFACSRTPVVARRAGDDRVEQGRNEPDDATVVDAGAARSYAADAVDAGPADAANTAPDAAHGQLDPDGDDDVDPGENAPDGGPLAPAMRFERVGRAPLSLQRICDLTPFGDALYAAHANQPLGTDGATISRYVPNGSKQPFSVAFDWNRPGEPTKGGGAGQGFLRVHRIGDRLFVTDADPPYAGFGLADWATEGYVFLSDAYGRFAPPRAPHHRPPGAPTAEKAGAAVLPRAYHVIDAIRFRGRYYASTGSVPPKQVAWRGPAPGALHVADDSLGRWTFAVDYPHPWRDGVWRLTFMVRFRDRLYVGIQDYDGREPNDYLEIEPPRERGREPVRQEDIRPVRVTPSGAASTLRWYADSGRLYWVAWARDGVHLRVTDDGEHWRAIDLPTELGAPLDLTRFRGELVVLQERGLVHLTSNGARVLARVDEKKSPFALGDSFCAAPLAVFGGVLYAGGQRDGALYRIVESVGDGGAPP